MSDIGFVLLAYLAALGTYALYAAALESRVRRATAMRRRIEGAGRHERAPTTHRTAKG